MSEPVTVTRTYLELPRLNDLHAARIDDDPLIRVARVPAPSPELAKRLYRAVGGPYHWVDRWKWSEAEWAAWVARPGFGTWVLSYDGDEAGFYDLHWDDTGACEIELFGLRKEFHGRGLGKHMLTRAVEIAFTVGASRVWLHTCSLDDARALPNYIARGFRAYKTEQYTAEI
jgi:GNAT superfamily N-acetyltransferase